MLCLDKFCQIVLFATPRKSANIHEIHRRRIFRVGVRM